MSTPQTTIIEGNYVDVSKYSILLVTLKHTYDYGIIIRGGPVIARNNVFTLCYAGFQVDNYRNRNILNNIQFVFNTFISDYNGALIALNQWSEYGKIFFAM